MLRKRPQINDQILYLKEFEKETNSKVSNRKEIKD